MSQLLDNDDVSWVLATCKVVDNDKTKDNSNNSNNSDHSNDDDNNSDGIEVMNRIKIHVKELCKQNLQRFMAFEDVLNQSLTNNIFIMIRCDKTIQFAERQVKMLLKDIGSDSDIRSSVSISMAGVYRRNLSTLASHIIDSTTKKSVAADNDNDDNDNDNDNNGSNQFEWNIFDRQIFELNLEKKRNVFLQTVLNCDKLAGKESYKERLNSIANNYDSSSTNNNWVLALTVMNSERNVKDKDKESSKEEGEGIILEYVAALVGNQVISICDKYNKLCWGYRGDYGQFGLLIKCENGGKGSSNSSNNSVNAVGSTIMNQLFDNVDKLDIGKFEVKINICGGVSQLREDETGREWQDRAEEGIKQAQQKGGNQFCWIK